MYEIGAQVTATGPEPDPPVWKIYDAIDRQNGKVSHAELLFIGLTEIYIVQTVRENHTEKMHCKY